MFYTRKKIYSLLALFQIFALGQKIWYSVISNKIIRKVVDLEGLYFPSKHGSLNPTLQMTCGSHSLITAQTQKDNFSLNSLDAWNWFFLFWGGKKKILHTILGIIILSVICAIENTPFSGDSRNPVGFTRHQDWTQLTQSLFHYNHHASHALFSSLSSSSSHALILYDRFSTFVSSEFFVITSSSLHSLFILIIVSVSWSGFWLFYCFECSVFIFKIRAFLGSAF